MVALRYMRVNLKRKIFILFISILKCFFLNKFSAAQQGHKEIVEILIKNNADLNMQSSTGVSPLYAGIFLFLMFIN